LTIRVEIEGLKELRDAVNNLEQSFDTAVALAAQDTVLAIRTKVIKALQSGGGGRVYQKYKPRRTHTASAPGQPPATDTGTLVSSIYFETDPKGATVGSRLVYASYLETGTRRNGILHMAARPIWLQTAEVEGQLFRQRILDEIRKFT
jgi:phage gpG-like protein